MSLISFPRLFVDHTINFLNSINHNLHELDESRYHRTRTGGVAKFLRLSKGTPKRFALLLFDFHFIPSVFRVSQFN